MSGATAFLVASCTSANGDKLDKDAVDFATFALTKRPQISRTCRAFNGVSLDVETLLTDIEYESDTLADYGYKVKLYHSSKWPIQCIKVTT